MLKIPDCIFQGRNKAGSVGWFPKSYVSMSGGDVKNDFKNSLAKDQVEKSKDSVGKDASILSSTPTAGVVYDVVTGWFLNPLFFVLIKKYSGIMTHLHTL